MVALKTVNCPSCAGDIKLDGTSERVTCSYCGTTSFVQRGARRAPANIPVIVVGPRITSLLALGIGLVALLFGVGAALSITLRPNPAPPAPPVLVAPAPIKHAPVASKAPEPPPSPVIRVLSDTPTLFADQDGDQHADAIAPISVTLAGARSEHYAVFDGRTGAQLARTPALSERNGALVALLERRLLAAQRDGQLAAYDLGSGDLQWSSALGERVVALCKGRTEGAAHVTTDAGRQLYLDLITGRQSVTKERCQTLLARAESARDPRDRRDYRAPPELESYTCGGVRVMGDQNYTVADACLARAHVDTDRLDGMVGHRLWRQGSDWLVFGVRKPGAYVPMVGRLRRGQFVWKSEVPSENPLDAEEGGPRFVALAGDQLAVAYQSRRGARWSVTTFGALDGVRRWTRALPENLRGGLQTLAAADDRVFVQAGDALILLDATEGELKAVIAGGR
jgi:PQQ-like domain